MYDLARILVDFVGTPGMGQKNIKIKGGKDFWTHT